MERDQCFPLKHFSVAKMTLELQMSIFCLPSIIMLFSIIPHSQLLSFSACWFCKASFSLLTIWSITSKPLNFSQKNFGIQFDNLGHCVSMSLISITLSSSDKSVSSICLLLNFWKLLWPPPTLLNLELLDICSPLCIWIKNIFQ